MSPYYEQGGVTLWLGEALEVLPSLPSVRLVVTDPPYVLGVSSWHQDKAGGWGDLMNSATWYASLLREFRRLTVNQQGAAWVFNSWRSFPILARASYLADWPIDSLVVWDKQWIGPACPRSLRPSYEMIALLGQPGFTIPDRGARDIWECPWSSNKPTGHPAEKPVPLLRRIIETSGGGSVLDPFAGSGSVLLAARNAGIPAIGIEIEERWCELIANRLSQKSLGLDDPLSLLFSPPAPQNTLSLEEV